MEERERKHSQPPPSDPGSSNTPVPEATDDDRDKIDVCSQQFDPLRALYSPTVQVPFPNIKCFNNVAEYESFLKGGRGRALPENLEKRRRKATKGVADLERIERLKKLMVNNPVSEAEGQASSSVSGRRRRDKPQKNVLTRMPLCKGSPLGELYRCVDQRIRVKVHIRTFKGLRGVCSGFVVAFDKFWNMAMVDVDETYREPLLGEAFYHEKTLTISRLFQKLTLQEGGGADDPVNIRDAQEKDGKGLSAAAAATAGQAAEGRTAEPKPREAAKDKLIPKVRQKKDSPTYGKVHTRHLNQVFIRGENVILVNPQPL